MVYVHAQNQVMSGHIKTVLFIGPKWIWLTHFMEIKYTCVNQFGGLILNGGMKILKAEFITYI